MCRLEQLGNNLRRAVRDVVCDENFDESAAPRHHLDFEILVHPTAALCHAQSTPLLLLKEALGASSLEHLFGNSLW